MWKNQFYQKVRAYMIRDIKIAYLSDFLNWWHRFGGEIMNEFDFLIDEEKDKAAMKELFDLKSIILRDANIDNDDPNVQRINFHIVSMLKELDQEVDYENPTREEMEAMEEDPQ